MGVRPTIQTKRVREPLLETGNQAPLPGEQGILNKFNKHRLLIQVASPPPLPPHSEGK